MSLSIQQAKEIIADPYDEKELLPLVLFRGNTSLGRTIALWKFAKLCQEAEIPDLRQASVISATALRNGNGAPLPNPSDLGHLSGLHHSLTKASLWSFFSRLKDSPSVMAITPGMADYVNYLGRRNWFYHPTKIEMETQWRTRVPWRKSLRQSHQRHQTTRPEAVIEIPTFYPFIIGAPQEEHDLILRVDRCVPKDLPESIRQDVCQDLLVAIISGEISIENLQDSVPKYVKSVFRQYPMKYGPLSLDRPAPWGEDERTLGELLSTDTGKVVRVW